MARSRFFHEPPPKTSRRASCESTSPVLAPRKRAEEALRGVSAELRQTLYTAATGLNHCSRDLRILSANPAYAHYIGLPLEQIVGRPIVEVMGQAAFEIIRPPRREGVEGRAG
jgi:PAS domain-containing protein